MDRKVSIAVIILTYNEAVHLARALRHVCGFSSEIFVIDSFSTDKTLEIAYAYGAQVLQHRFENQARQFAWALENAPITADWVMRLDADEIVESDLAEEIEKRLPDLPPDVTGINLNRKTIFQGKFIRHGGRYPLILLRIWRRGKAKIEDRWMDEHLYLTEGRSVHFRGGFADHSLFDLTSFWEKHNRYASREALDVVNRKLHLFEQSIVLTSQAAPRQAKIKRFVKEEIYNRIPFEISASVYFLFRYLVQLGFLDGRRGLSYHLFQGLLYRLLVGAKVRELETALRSATSRDEARRVAERLTHFSLVKDET